MTGGHHSGTWRRTTCGSEAKASNHAEIAFSPWVTSSRGNDVALNFPLLVSVGFLYGEADADAICVSPVGPGLCSVPGSPLLSLIESGQQDFLLDSPSFLRVRFAVSKQFPRYVQVFRKP